MTGAESSNDRELFGAVGARRRPSRGAHIRTLEAKIEALSVTLATLEARKVELLADLSTLEHATVAMRRRLWRLWRKPKDRTP
jgi:hypothetical protein